MKSKIVKLKFSTKNFVQIQQNVLNTKNNKIENIDSNNNNDLNLLKNVSKKK